MQTYGHPSYMQQGGVNFSVVANINKVENITHILQIIQNAIDNPRSKEEIKLNFINAGIIDEQGNLIEPYKDIYLV